MTATAPLHYDDAWFDVDALRRTSGVPAHGSLMRVYAKCAPLCDLEMAFAARRALQDARAKYPHDDAPLLDALLKQADAAYHEASVRAGAVVRAAVWRTFHVWLRVKLQSRMHVGDVDGVLTVADDHRELVYCPRHVCKQHRYRGVDDDMETMRARIIVFSAHLSRGADDVNAMLRALVGDALVGLRDAVMRGDDEIVAPIALRAIKTSDAHENGCAQAKKAACKTSPHLVVTLKRKIDLAAAKA